MKQQKDILQEMKELNSALADHSRSMPYEVPEGYFNVFPEQMAAHLQLKNQTVKEMPGAVPEGYFEALPAELLNKIKQDEPRKSKTIKIALRWTAAAILLALITIGSYTILNNQSNSFDKQLAAVPASELNEYIHNNINQFDIETIENELLADNTIDVTTGQLQEDDIVNYLNEAGWITENKYN